MTITRACHRGLGALAAAMVALAPPVVHAADPIAEGAGRIEIALGAETLEVFTYRPRCSEPALLIVLHGQGRNADGYRDYARPLADRLCLLVVAPRFDRRRFPQWRYQHGGIVRGGVVRPSQDWTAGMIAVLVVHVRAREARALPVSLIGHSAGGQFLSRLAAFAQYPAERIVIANPGTHVLADLTVKAPYGLGGVFDGAAGEAALRRYLAAPITLLLGQADTGNEDLNDSPEAKAQGATRHERGLNAFRSAEARAKAAGWPFNWRLVEVPGIGHTAKRMFGSDQAAEALRP